MSNESTARTFAGSVDDARLQMTLEYLYTRLAEVERERDEAQADGPRCAGLSRICRSGHLPGQAPMGDFVNCRERLALWCLRTLVPHGLGQQKTPLRISLDNGQSDPADPKLVLRLDTLDGYRIISVVLDPPDAFVEYLGRAVSDWREWAETLQRSPQRPAGWSHSAQVETDEAAP